MIRKPELGAVFDAVIVGAGFAGMYMLHCLRGLGISARVYEAGGDVGGTWYWNRYPGARCDVESMQYSYSFCDALEQEWRWSEKYSPQPEILAYARHVAERFELRRDIRFGTRVTAARFDETAKRWLIETDLGDRASAQFFILAVGCLSAANKPPFAGIEDFKGPIYHTGEWPHEEVDFAGWRVGVIGTGYYETYNLPHVKLVDVSAKPIERFTRQGIVANGTEYPADVAVFATGYAGMTGSFERIRITGRKGLTLAEKWRAGPRTYLGISSAGFPNLFMVAGSGSPSVLASMIQAIEQHVDWITDCIGHLREAGAQTIEPLLKAEDDWVHHLTEVAQISLRSTCNSWYLGANVPGRPRVFMPYIGGFPVYVNRCNEVMAKGYEGFVLEDSMSVKAPPKARWTERWRAPLDVEVISPAMLAAKRVPVV